MTAKRSLAILSVSAGAGHVRAAEAVKTAAEARGWQATHVDVMDHVPRLFRRAYAGGFLDIINRSPAFWGFLYHHSDQSRRDSTASKLRRLVESLNTRRLTAHLADLAPTAVVCTHFLPAQLLGQRIAKGNWQTPVHTVITDFDVHALWLQPHQTSYCVAAEEIAWRLRERLAMIEPGRTTPIYVTGIPIAAAFRSAPSRADAARELGLDPALPTLVLMSGGLGVGAIDAIAARLLAIPGPHQLIAMAGRNAELLERLNELARSHPGRLIPRGFTTTPERICAAADLAISKPGGLTTSECLSLGLPLLVISPIPGQEERNSDYLLEHGAALKAHDAAGVEFRVRRILAEPALLADLKRHAARLGRPDAADAVLRAVEGAS